MTSVLTPIRPSILEEIGIDLQSIKLIRPFSKRSRYIALVQWLTKYVPRPEASDFALEKVQGYLEAFTLLCEVEDWEKAWKIFSLRVEPSTGKELYDHLSIIGSYTETLHLCEKLLGRLTPQVDAICWKGRGVVYQIARNDYCEAIQCFRKSWAIAQEIHDKDLQVVALQSLGSVYRRQGKQEQAIQCFRKSWAIAQEIPNPFLEAISLHFLGLVCNDSGDYLQAREYYLRSLSLCRKGHDLQWQANSLCNLGRTYIHLSGCHRSMKTFQSLLRKARRHIQNALRLANITGDQYVKGWCLHNMGWLLIKQRQRSEAHEHLERAWEVFKELQNSHGQEETLDLLDLLQQSDEVSQEASPGHRRN